MITDEERESIINEAVERALLRLPDVVGSIIMDRVRLMKLNREFYQKFPELRTRKDLVAQVVGSLEGDNPGIGYEKLLEKATPILREQIKTMSKLDVSSAPKPSRRLPSLDNNGEL